MSGLFNALAKTESQPMLYIGSSSIQDLRRFSFSDIGLPRSEMKISTCLEETDFYKNFQHWLQQKFIFSPPNPGIKSFASNLLMKRLSSKNSSSS